MGVRIDGTRALFLSQTIRHSFWLLIDGIGTLILDLTWLAWKRMWLEDQTQLIERNIMAKQDKSTESVYRVTEVIGTSAQSWEDAAKTAVQTAAGTLRDLRIAEVVKMDVKIENGKVLEFRARLQLSFKYES
jgi:flavin-binding protein dodecin